ncbi:hypothetical protein SEA_VIBAKI_75 [Arthrobacter phage Vibaki]|uniref:Uncharacterized protein n=1 Tax=Arthrobacter phage Vibaki TaxID=2593333 RepID=A0A514TZ71_9CAUD|nr:hypothetical protein HYP95_gp75 [Arthrobacter phage Vibaki]QDK01955.1 hypothetical protein SEA_VIBAKI_75 [Arthrobacter phage Vibaki]
MFTRSNILALLGGVGKGPKLITRCCPACSKKHAQLISSNCPVCGGYGIVTLGTAALSLHEPATVSIAVEIAVEAAARAIDTTLTLSDDRLGPVAATMTLLTDAGIIDHPTTRKTTHRTRHLSVVDIDPLDLAAEYVPTATPRDAALALAPAYIYAEHERPNARGLPILSANGHPSSTARIADPMPPGNDTAETSRQRASQRRSATVLIEAAPKVISIKTRQAAKKSAAQQAAA